MKKIKTFIDSLTEYDVISAIISLLFSLKIIFEFSWNLNFLNIIGNIIVIIMIFISLYYIIKAILFYSKENLTFRGFVIGFAVCYILFVYSNNIYDYGSESEYITATIDRYNESDNFEFYAENYINGKNNYLNLNEFAEDILMGKFEDDVICEIGKSMILKDNKYYYVCNDGIEKEYTPQDVEVIEIK